MTDVTVRYNGSIIGELHDSCGSIRLRTANATCVGDIVIECALSEQAEASHMNDLCTNITELTLHPDAARYLTPTSFATYPNLALIVVPWGVDEVPGAPWGATTASIAYQQ